MAPMDEFSREEAAARAGISPETVDRLVALDLVSPDESGRFSNGDIRRFGLLASLQAAGLPDEGMAAAFRTGRLTLDFMDNPVFSHFSALSGETFSDLGRRTGIDADLLMVIREAIGSAVPEPDDHVREIELSIVPLIEAQLALGYPPEAIERMLRTMGDALRRYVLAEAVGFAESVIAPLADRPGLEIGAAAERAAERLTEPSNNALLAIYHAQQAHAWTTNILDGWERELARTGLYAGAERPPAMCFLDITGYTRLTAERGDQAAFELAEQLNRLVQRTSIAYGGRPVKWLGDGVMFWFRDPGPGVVAALDMADGVIRAGLPPAHVGLHAGPVLFQDGDYFGQTVNLASRIAEYARPGEVLVSQAVVDAAVDTPVAFTPVGPVELKGIGATTDLHVARRA